MNLKPQTLVFVLVLMFAPIFSSCSSPDVTKEGQQRVGSYGGPASTTAVPDSGVVSVGDSIALSVWDNTQFSTHTVINLNGTLTIPLIGEVKVLGFNKEELTRVIRRRLSEYVKGDVLFSLEVIKPSPKITVLGMVGHQGNFPISREVSLIDALLGAGGWSETADLRYIRITHQSALGPEKTAIEFDMTPFVETGDTRGIPTVRAGDIIIVPKRQNYLRDVSDFVRDVFFLLGFLSIFR